MFDESFVATIRFVLSANRLVVYWVRLIEISIGSIHFGEEFLSLEQDRHWIFTTGIYSESILYRMMFLWWYVVYY